jgi:hypothetical protein
MHMRDESLASVNGTRTPKTKRGISKKVTACLASRDVVTVVQNMRNPSLLLWNSMAQDTSKNQKSKERVGRTLYSQ